MLRKDSFLMNESNTLYPKIPNDLILKLVKISIDKEIDINTLIVNAIDAYTSIRINDISNPYYDLDVSDITNNLIFILDDLKNVINNTSLVKIGTFFSSISLDLDETSNLKHIADVPNVLRKLLNLLLTDKLVQRSILNPENTTINNALTDLKDLTDEGLYRYCISLFSSQTNIGDIVLLVDNSIINWLYEYRQKLIDTIQSYSLDDKAISELSALLYEILHFDETDHFTKSTDTEAEQTDDGDADASTNDAIDIANSVSLVRNKDDVMGLLNPDEDATDVSDDASNDDKLNKKDHDAKHDEDAIDDMMSPLIDKNDDDMLDSNDAPF